LNFNRTTKLIAKPILKEIEARLFFLYDVGLTYLTLSRDARTISGGEASNLGEIINKASREDRRG